jgi:pimeloyl-ACP methyl ester carboxylesterase
MKRRWAIGIGVVAVLLVLLVVNALVVDGETESAQVTVPGGRILDLPQGDLQVFEQGPRDGPPIVLIHCYTCELAWWEGVVPLLERNHRVIRVDLLGHGGSEKPGSGYAPEEQAGHVAAALERLDLGPATVVGHSLGGTVSVALAEQDPQLVERVAILDMPPDDSFGDLGFIAELVFYPLFGEALWTVKPDASIRDGLQKAFAPGFEVPDSFVEGVKRMTYTAYDDTIAGQEAFLDGRSLDRRLRQIDKPLMVLMGAEEQIVDDPQRALDQYKRSVPQAQIHLIAGAGHSPNVEKPRETARIILAFAQQAQKQVGSSVRDVTERGTRPQQGTPGNVR